MVSLAVRRRAVTYLRSAYEISERRACQAIGLNRSSYRYVGARPVVDEAYRAVVELSKRYPRWGYRKIYALLRGRVAVSRERVRLIRRREGLQVVRRCCKRRLLGTTTQWVRRAHYPNHVWSYDFVFDQTQDARQLKCLTVVDEFTRQGLAIRVGRSLTAGDVIRVLTELFARHGRPACLRSDNGPELVSRAVQTWLGKRHVDTHYIAPGSPWENAYCESFNSIFRTTCLDRWLFGSMMEARVVIAQWLHEYNTIRPHGSLAGLSPAMFLQKWTDDNRINQAKTLTGWLDQKSWACQGLPSPIVNYQEGRGGNIIHRVNVCVAPQLR